MSEIGSSMCICRPVNCTLFVLDSNQFFPTDFPKNAKTSNFMKIDPVGAEFSHADGRTDTTKLVVAFRNFSKAPNNQYES
jgi:hypothetical protein